MTDVNRILVKGAIQIASQVVEDVKNRKFIQITALIEKTREKTLYGVILEKGVGKKLIVTDSSDVHPDIERYLRANEITGTIDLSNLLHSFELSEATKEVIMSKNYAHFISDQLIGKPEDFFERLESIDIALYIPDELLSSPVNSAALLMTMMASFVNDSSKMPQYIANIFSNPELKNYLKEVEPVHRADEFMTRSIGMKYNPANNSFVKRKIRDTFNMNLKSSVTDLILKIF